MSDIVNNDNNIRNPINDVNDERNTLASSSSDTVSYQPVIENQNARQCSIDTNKIEQLKSCLEADIHSCDFTWSLFHSALNSYRFDSCLRPYPPMFLKNGYKDPTRMVSFFLALI